MLGLVPRLPEHPDEVRHGRLRGGGELGGGPHPAVELLGLQLYPVPQRLVAEDDLERNEGDSVPVEDRVRKVGCAVGDDANLLLDPVLQAAMLGPHVLGLGLLQRSPTGRHR